MGRPAGPSRWPGRSGDPAGEVFALILLAMAAYYREDPQTSLALCRPGAADRCGLRSWAGWTARCGAVLGGRADRGRGSSPTRSGPAPPGLAAARKGRRPVWTSLIAFSCWRSWTCLAGRLPGARAHLREATEIAALCSAATCSLLPARLNLLRAPVRANAAPRPRRSPRGQHPAALANSAAGCLACRTKCGWRQEPLQKSPAGTGTRRGARGRGTGRRDDPGRCGRVRRRLLGGRRCPADGPGSWPAAPAGARGTVAGRRRALQGRTHGHTAAQLYISIRTVRSHLDRIRDKTGCRRRADLTRLALQATLV